MNVIVLIVCTVLLRVHVSDEFSRFFLMFCIIKLVAYAVYRKYNVSLWNTDLALAVSSICNQN